MDEYIIIIVCLQRSLLWVIFPKLQLICYHFLQSLCRNGKKMQISTFLLKHFIPLLFILRQAEN